MTAAGRWHAWDPTAQSRACLFIGCPFLSLHSVQPKHKKNMQRHSPPGSGQPRSLVHPSTLCTHTAEEYAEAQRTWERTASISSPSSTHCGAASYQAGAASPASRCSPT